MDIQIQLVHPTKHSVSIYIYLCPIHEYPWNQTHPCKRAHRERCKCMRRPTFQNWRGRKPKPYHVRWSIISRAGAADSETVLLVKKLSWAKISRQQRRQQKGSGAVRPESLVCIGHTHGCTCTSRGVRDLPSQPSSGLIDVYRGDVDVPLDATIAADKWLRPQPGALAACPGRPPHAQAQLH